jgi:hypothetical protein
VFKSIDAGESWRAVNAGLTNLWVDDLAIDTATPATLHAGTWGGGVFDLGQTELQHRAYLPLILNNH